MLACAMLLGSGDGNLPTYTITLGANRAQWVKSIDRPDIPTTIAVRLLITVGANIEVQSSDINYGAIHLDGLYNGSKVVLTNNGYVLGKGGKGGDGAIGGLFGGGVGWNGGPAVRANYSGTLTILNSFGYVWGGGGGGGGGGSSNSGTGFGGGGGAGGGAAGAGTAGATAGTSGRYGTYGLGGTPTGTNSGAGANGADWGSNASPGENALSYGWSYGNGGTGGYAVKHDAGTVVTLAVKPGRVIGSVGT